MSPVWIDAAKLTDTVYTKKRQTRADRTYVTQKTMHGTRVELNRRIECVASVEPFGKGNIYSGCFVFLADN